jgi:hypothetical protein
MIFGQRNFMLAALLAVSGILLFLREKEEEEK